MKVVFCWSDISGYMAACWRALSLTPGVTVKVIAYAPKLDANTPFDAQKTMAGIDYRLLTPQERIDANLIQQLVRAEQADAIVVSGWFNPAYIALSRDAHLARSRFIVGIDTPFRGDLRQRLAPFALRKYLSRADALVVAGERAWQYAIRLGVAKDNIYRGIYAVDFAAFSRSADMRAIAAWPRRFLFTGRYENAKALDVLVEAYKRYRNSITDSWPLTCCGRGELASLLKGVDGIEDRGFVQPADQQQLLAEHGAFLLPSRYDPWPLVLVEACAAGLPIVCSEACGSAVELVRPMFNGFRVPTENAARFADAMTWLHRHYNELPAMGARSRSFAAAHDAKVWARYWSEVILPGH